MAADPGQPPARASAEQTAPQTEEYSDTELEEGRLFFAQECTFERGAPKVRDLPPPGPPEVAFAGRSNVGKSSLINALTGRSGLARTSNTPGRTQELNAFMLGSPTRGWLRLIDLPGYGYAKVSKSKSSMWTKEIFTYLRGRPQLRRALILIDARHGLKDSDHSVMEMMDTAAVSYQVVLTKADKLKPKELETCLIETVKALRPHVAAHPVIMPTASLKGDGIPELRASLTKLREL